ncbi:MAG: hypothetical protein ABI461_06565 [Polyangiaceae bacterium]
MKKREWLLLPAFLLLSCAPSPASEAPGAVKSPASTAASDAAATPLEARDASTDGAASTDGGDSVTTLSPFVGHDEAVDMLFTAAADNTSPPSCAGDDAAAIHCLLHARYVDSAGDDLANGLAAALYDSTGDVVGVVKEHVMDGGYRGMLHLVPVFPTGANRVHLTRVSNALADYDRFFAELQAKGNARVAYRWRALSLRFFRSVKARTPSAYASGWRVAYNVDGSLNKTGDSVRETMFHEIFHLNDSDHGAKGDDWADRALESTYEDIHASCRFNKSPTMCLEKFAPNDTMVKGGTYYAFQPGNDVREYAAELAVRYYKEQRGALGQGSAVKIPFKCTGKGNAAAWKKLVDEFFGAIDLTGACP